jgi:hypothetical protein
VTHHSPRVHASKRSHGCANTRANRVWRLITVRAERIVHTDTSTHKHTHTHTHTLTHTHTRTHTPPHTHKHTNTHTHLQATTPKGAASTATVSAAQLGTKASPSHASQTQCKVYGSRRQRTVTVSTMHPPHKHRLLLHHLILRVVELLVTSTDITLLLRTHRARGRKHQGDRFVLPTPRVSIYASRTPCGAPCPHLVS